MSQTKVCTKCKVEKDIEEFPMSVIIGVRTPRCGVCIKEYRKAYGARYRERMRG